MLVRARARGNMKSRLWYHSPCSHGSTHSKGDSPDGMLSDLPIMESDFVAVDLETTGCAPGRHGVIEIGAVRVSGGRIVGEFTSLVRPADALPRAIAQLTGITLDMLATAPSIDDVLPAFRAFAQGAVLVAHNYRFDLGFLDFEAERLWGEPFPRPALDTITLARRLLPGLERYSLAFLAGHLSTSVRPDHRAGNDARATAEILVTMLPGLTQRGLVTVGDLAAFCDLEHQHALAARLPLTAGVPDAPGLYIFRDAEDRVLYVGRAKSLRQRVRSHFYPGGHSERSELGRLVDSVRAVPAASALDAALLERRLVSRHEPPFNPVAQRAHTVYLVHVDAHRPYPGIKVVTSRRKKGTHLGPFTSRWAARTLVDRLAEIYGLRRCARRVDAALASRDCEHRENGCPSPCVVHVDPTDYSLRLAAFLRAFDDAEEPRGALTSLQAAAASEARYEDAIRYRDALRALDRALGVQRVLRSASAHDAALVEHCEGCVVVHLVRAGLRAAVLRGTPASIGDRLPLALHRVYFAERPRPDLLDLGPREVAEMLAIAAFAAGDAHVEVLVADERLALAAVRRSVGLERRQPRRRHAAS
jgi:DNA polymerase-3 subunit epsilon